MLTYVIVVTVLTEVIVVTVATVVRVVTEVTVVTVGTVVTVTEKNSQKTFYNKIFFTKTNFHQKKFFTKILFSVNKFFNKNIFQQKTALPIFFYFNYLFTFFSSKFFSLSLIDFFHQKTVFTKILFHHNIFHQNHISPKSFFTKN